MHRGTDQGAIPGDHGSVPPNHAMLHAQASSEDTWYCTSMRSGRKGAHRTM